jgi:two-component system response regulator PilR (NtrC family)
MQAATLVTLPTPSARLLIGQSPAMALLRQHIAKVARSQAPVFIGGETGSGKELVARALHEASARRDGPFVAVNCGALPPQLLESEFFGYRKGSFTHAGKDHAGLFQAAQGGSLFLDEIAELPLALQAKLLRAVQEKTIRPLGATREIAVDLRLISASHKNLAQEVAAGHLRQDLYYRLNVVTLHVPPLRERREDLPLLIEHILARLAHELRSAPFVLSAAALERLAAHPFFGNVRELDNLLQRACALAEGPRLELGDFVESLQNTMAEPSLTPPLAQAPPLNWQLDELARHEIEHALAAQRWNRSAAARQLGLTPRALRYRLHKLGMTL